VVPGRSNLFASLGPVDAPAILFLGHSDVVPAGDGWATDPFVPDVSGGLITGRGATDMKGGLAAIVAAMAAVHAKHPDIRLELLSTVDEEDQASGAHKAMEKLEGRSLLACVVAEPTNLEIVIGCRGSTNFHLDITGKSAHGGRPEDGASSIDVAGMVIERIRRAQAQARSAPKDALLGGPSWNVGTVRGGTATSVVPQETKMTINRRIMPGENPDEILQGLLHDVRADIASSDIPNASLLRVSGQVVLHMPGFRTSEESGVPTQAQTALADLGVEAPLTGWTAACEGGFVTNATNAPTIILGPGDLNTQAHQANESVTVTDLLVAAKAYALLAIRLNKGSH
jgi:succinyl-diaminopimelate desuccinylase